ncbi:alkyl hydroperoxide reductase [Hyphobacterium sp. CCMP332]|nr:alkyl hydroperoxide reductase [Hyphobacterium sp. CCMP332]
MTETQGKFILRIAGIYNMLFGLVTIIFPNLFFEMAGMDLPLYPMIWQCVGMIVGVYGLGYWIAAGDPGRHWPIVLVGFLGKLFGPIGFAWYLAQGVFPFKWGLIIMFNDIIWWLPFGILLYEAYKASKNQLSYARR